MKNEKLNVYFVGLPRSTLFKLSHRGFSPNQFLEPDEDKEDGIPGHLSGS